MSDTIGLRKKGVNTHIQFIAFIPFFYFGVDKKYSLGTSVCTSCVQHLQKPFGLYSISVAINKLTDVYYWTGYHNLYLCIYVSSTAIQQWADADRGAKERIDHHSTKAGGWRSGEEKNSHRRAAQGIHNTKETQFPFMIHATGM